MCAYMFNGKNQQTQIIKQLYTGPCNAQRLKGKLCLGRHIPLFMIRPFAGRLGYVFLDFEFELRR